MLNVNKKIKKPAVLKPRARVKRLVQFVGGTLTMAALKNEQLLVLGTLNSSGTPFVGDTKVVELQLTHTFMAKFVEL